MKGAGVTVFIIALLLFMGITLVVYPNLPPGMILQETMLSYGIPGLSYSIFGFSGEALLNGILNGVFWGILFTLVFIIGRRASREKVVMIPVSNPTPPVTPVQHIIKVPMRVLNPIPKVKNTYVLSPKLLPPIKKLEQDVETIEGIGPTYGGRLRDVGVTSITDLLLAGSTRNERSALANKISVAPTTVLKWISRADFFRIRGVGKQYSDLIVAAGVNNVDDLSRCNPKNLYAKLKDTDRKMNLVKRPPSFNTVKRWIAHAEKLQRIVEY
jgi:predicted flap endonuclease-1-like 5' DNA nuclease